MIVLCDLDGTLADCSHRLHYIQKDPKDWDSFYMACGDDKMIEPMAEILSGLSSRVYKIWIVTGRSDIAREATESWLEKHDICYDRLLMRQQGDHTPDHILKPSWIKSGLISKNQILCVFEDRSSVVKAWRDLGLTVFQVAEGAF